VKFIANKAEFGGGLFPRFFCSIMMQNGTTVIFINNKANTGGAVMCDDNSQMVIVDTSKVSFSHNSATQGGAIHSGEMSTVTFEGHSSVRLDYNVATQNGGAISSSSGSNTTFAENAKILFLFNEAKQNGAAIYCVINVQFLFTGNSSIVFENNTAEHNGGAVYLYDNAAMLFTEFSTIRFQHNIAMQHGGAVYFTSKSTVSFEGNCVAEFLHHTAKRNGGVMYSSSENEIYFMDNSNITIFNNSGRFNGGAMFLNDNVTIMFAGNTVVTFTNNSATRDGGALYSIDKCSTIIKDYSTVAFTENVVMQYGGAIHCDSHSNITFQGNVSVVFAKNNAGHGGAIFILQSSILFVANSTIQFSDNSAMINGGAIHLRNNLNVKFHESTNITFYCNNATKYGGAIYVYLTQGNLSKITFNNETDFSKNDALISPSVYIDVQPSCNETCLNNSVLGINKETVHSHGMHIVTPPNKLILHKPATCMDIHDSNNTSCETYFVKDIMLGQNIVIEACVLDYYDRPAGGAQFLAHGNDTEHSILNGSELVLVSCDKLEGIRVTGDEVFHANNFSMTLTSHVDSLSDLKTITVELIIELLPCYPGFHYDANTETCMCYNVSDIVSCVQASSMSDIKKGYWFGTVDTKPTFTVCPNGYCNFTCCESTNGLYQLSPQRMNQCNSHRYGPACGVCEKGYTLSFDSVECVSVDQCTIGQTVLVVSLSILYWIATVIAVFIVTYYHVGISYLYAITFYYSMLDILLSQNLQLSHGIFTTVNIVSSIAKVIPQFLGQFCLVESMNGIDQQFIHYVHPIAVTAILTMICFLARMSYRFSLFISRGIIHVICFLLLLSYTSLATTSLLLLRPLIFHDISKVYTYLSPDIEYFHGRHLPYVIVAVLCAIVIVIGLPLLLLLEPYLNGKINFTKVKPLLDQFQGCYKDQYRSFAAYYMVCRLAIILIIISDPSDHNSIQVLLVSVSTILASIHQLLKPYAINILNIFDGIILQYMVLVTVVPLVENFHPDLLLAVIITLVILPLITFAAIELIIHKKKVYSFVSYCKSKPVTTSGDNNIPMRDIGIIVDDQMRKNATICEM